MNKGGVIKYTFSKILIIQESILFNQESFINNSAVFTDKLRVKSI